MASLLQQACRKHGVDISSEPDDLRRITIYSHTAKAILRLLAEIKHSRLNTGAMEVLTLDLGVIICDVSLMRIHRSRALTSVVSAQGALQNLLQAQMCLRKVAVWLETDITVEQDIPLRDRQLKAIELVLEAYNFLASGVEYLEFVQS